ncbi:MAG: hypothetical protein A2158_04535 [Chloroflexi bacterium RBG_13_46_14]|nr:MAG: hypothetical protein A2158_04535 [Chloroflexi bacterium RBG_13_46_14]
MKNRIMGGWFKETIADKFLYITLVLSVLLGWLGDEQILRDSQCNIGSAMVDLSGALLGIVIAGLAIFIVFLDIKYLELLKQITDIERNIWPFKWVSVLTILSLVLGMLLLVIGNPPTIILRTIITVSIWSYLYLLIEMYRLIKFLTGHLRNRVKQLEIEEKKKSK